MERICASLKGRIKSAEEAAALIQSGMTLGMSGFTIVGYPKAIPAALAQSRHARELTVCIGASVGDELDGAMARVGILSRRYSYQSNKDMRDGINAGRIAYSDMHVSHFPLLVNQGIGPEIDVAVIECTAITEQGLIPAASVGCADAVVRAAKRVIVEINTTLPEGLYGMHDIFEVGVPPTAKPIPILKTTDRVGVPYISCPMEKIVAVVFTEAEDQPARFKPATETSNLIAGNVVTFLKSEISAGRLPENIGPIQSGVGSVGNAVLQGLTQSGFKNLTMYTEVMQDAALALLEKGVFSAVSASAVSLEAESRKRFYRHIDDFRQRIVLRPQEISNHPEIIRRLGVVALNTPMEVDIYGNANSTHIMGSAIMNGIGGSGDFTRNARLNVFATESTAKGGLISCIVPMASHVDHTEHDTQVIVTEQGVADLRWKSPRERAALLIENCAHPNYKPLLWDYFERALRLGGQTPHDLKTALSFHERFMETGSMKG